jgi:hypothetical protein
VKKMLLGSPAVVCVTKNKNYFVTQCYMHNLMVSSMVDEESDAKKCIGNK